MDVQKSELNNFLLKVSLFVAAVLIICIAVLNFRFEFENYHHNFTPDNTDLNTISKYIKNHKITSLLITGDVMLGRSVMQKYMELDDFVYPFRKVGPKLRESDIVFVNLENPIIDNCPIHTTGFKFCSPPGSIEGLLFAGVDIVNLANNHTTNYGEESLSKTVKLLADRGILSTGLGELVTIERNDTVFGFLGFDKSQQINPKLEPFETDLIITTDAKVDILIIAMHWGVEYENEALPGVRSLARELVYLGADVVVGHHPHWVQNWEYLEGKPVFYSLGNFIFDQMWSEETRKGLAVELIYEDGVLKEHKLIPTYMNSWAQPEFVE